MTYRAVWLTSQHSDLLCEFPIAKETFPLDGHNSTTRVYDQRVDENIPNTDIAMNGIALPHGTLVS